MLVKRGLQRLQNVVVTSTYSPFIESLLHLTLENQLIVHSFIKRRQQHLKQQVIVRVREYIVKQKLAQMFF